MPNSHLNDFCFTYTFRRLKYQLETLTNSAPNYTSRQLHILKCCREGFKDYMHQNSASQTKASQISFCKSELESFHNNFLRRNIIFIYKPKVLDVIVQPKNEKSIIIIVTYDFLPQKKIFWKKNHIFLFMDTKPMQVMGAS